MKKFDKETQRRLAKWSLDCAERVLPLFENAFPDDDRPRRAIETGRKWLRTGIFKMAEIRGASLSAHAAARHAGKNEAARLAARAAGQAVATAHVTQHCYGGAVYALKAITAANEPDDSQVENERAWQSRRLPASLRKEIMRRITIAKDKHGPTVKLRKGPGF